MKMGNEKCFWCKNKLPSRKTAVFKTKVCCGYCYQRQKEETKVGRFIGRSAKNRKKHGR